jgi:hypothetical protein
VNYGLPFILGLHVATQTVKHKLEISVGHWTENADPLQNPGEPEPQDAAERQIVKAFVVTMNGLSGLHTGAEAR